jgi:hypothetical protein
MNADTKTLLQNNVMIAKYMGINPIKGISEQTGQDKNTITTTMLKRKVMKHYLNMTKTGVF